MCTLGWAVTEVWHLGACCLTDSLETGKTEAFACRVLAPPLASAAATFGNGRCEAGAGVRASASAHQGLQPIWV